MSDLFEGKFSMITLRELNKTFYGVKRTNGEFWTFQKVWKKLLPAKRKLSSAGKSASIVRSHSTKIQQSHDRYNIVKFTIPPIQVSQSVSELKAIFCYRLCTRIKFTSALCGHNIDFDGKILWIFLSLKDCRLPSHIITSRPTYRISR